ncbi:MAG: ABC transporter permease [Elusimicrobia bacterium]|nr:ABC transporter permease [Patescibacteria group bacterium]MCG2724760.1 ABC transporter permease [Elusimicrobiota bacterium]
MKISELLKTGSLEIWHHKMRSFLSFFAISIGVISILYSLILIYSMSYRTKKALEIAGPGKMTVQMQGDGGSVTINENEPVDMITLEDSLAIRKEFTRLYMVSPSLKKYVRISHGKFNIRQAVEGINTQWRRRGWIYNLKGRFINQYDVDNFERVCVIIKDGGWIKKPKWMKIYSWRDKFQEYIKHNEVLGSTIQLGDNLYTVVGILEEPVLEKNPKTFLSVSGGWSAKIFVPITTAQRFLSGWSYSGDGIESIDIDTGGEKTITSYKKKIEKFIQSRHSGKLRFEIKDYRELIKEQLADKARDMYTVLIIGIIAIMAGGIGIMNVTLATVYSRIKEIGIRRAIGATRTNIMAQFMVEATFLGFIGGIVGVFVGIVGIQYLASKGNTDMMMVQWWMPFLSVLAAMLTGFFASIYPAWNASKLDPVEALKYE